MLGAPRSGQAASPGTERRRPAVSPAPVSTNVAANATLSIQGTRLRQGGHGRSHLCGVVMADQVTDQPGLLSRALAEPTEHVRGRWITGLGLASLGMWMAALTPLQ